ncbi:MAG: hypothetical protein HeimC2_21790 [Candidatus Heimdallarchaeota archaeon LC_2]|nr:MAG: hypothetical protein HeimC2_21790 [Candidatus Heimdallarchaeota archaeon LC_2]
MQYIRPVSNGCLRVCSHMIINGLQKTKDRSTVTVKVDFFCQQCQVHHEFNLNLIMAKLNNQRNKKYITIPEKIRPINRFLNIIESGNYQ